MKVTYFGTTVLLFDDGKDQILFDCHITRPSVIHMVVGRIRTDRNMADRILKQHKMNRVRAIFISHSHHDHVMDAPYFAFRTRADIYGTESALNVARGGRVPERKLHVFSPEESVKIGDYTVTVIPSVHSEAKWYNNDLGKVIDKPLRQPARRKAYKEGGSYDFLVENGGKKYLIRPSFNYVEGELDGVYADVLFLGIAGIAKATEEKRQKFFEETIEKVQPELVIPIHWDNFFISLGQPVKGMFSPIERTENAMYELQKYCIEHEISCVVQFPETFIII